MYRLTGEIEEVQVVLHSF